MQSSPPLPAVGAHRRRQPPAPSAPAYLAATLSSLVLAALAYSHAAFPRFPHPPATRLCRPDAEGSWSAGVFLGDSPFSLKPIEHVTSSPSKSPSPSPSLLMLLLFNLVSVAAVGDLQWRWSGVAGGEPSGDVRGRGGGWIPQQLRRQPLSLHPGLELRWLS